jgi:4-hydroxybenzoate polyprenyltransferase
MQQAVPAPGIFRKLRMTLEMIKFEHSIFALPFALTGALLAWRELGFPSAGMAAKLGWIVLAMVGARSAAMAFNRVLDASIDARNPRTSARHLPAGLLSRGFAWAVIGGSSLVFAGAAAMLNALCLALSPVALAIVFFYSYTKRFTSLSHLVLGFALGIAPAAAWIAVTGSLDLRILWLTAAVTCWTAGFDIIYSCQDEAFDRAAGLFSLPSRLGARRALQLARWLHVAMVLCLLALWQAVALGWVGLAGVVVVAALLAWEHRLVRHDDLSRVDAAFFTMNGYVSMVFFALWAVGAVLEKGN